MGGGSLKYLDSVIGASVISVNVFCAILCSHVILSYHTVVVTL